MATEGEKPGAWTLGEMMPGCLEQIDSASPEEECFFLVRRHSDGGYTLLFFDRAYSMKEPRYMAVLGREQLGGIATMLPGTEFWKVAWSNERRLDFLLNNGLIDS